MSAAGTAPPVPLTFNAETDMTKYRFVKTGTAANTVTAVDGITDLADFILVETVDVSEAAGASVWPLNRGGIVPIEAAAAISIGDEIAPSANGRAQTAVATQFARGIALEAATGAGHVIPVLVQFQEVVKS